MPCTAVVLDVGTVLQISESLESIVCRCFGPEGGQVLFTKATGEILITRDGKRILASLLLDHPVARMIVECASQHYNVTGDGTKAFIILLCEVLRGLEALVNKNEGHLFSGNIGRGTKHRKNGHMLKKIAHSLLMFQINVLENTIRHHLSKHFLSVFSMSSKRELCKNTLQLTLEAYFSGKIGNANQKYIANMASDFFHKCLACEDGEKDMVNLVDEYFSELHTAITGLPVASSRILPGLVLHRDFAVFCPAEGDIRALIVTDPIHNGFSATGFDFAINSEEQFLLFELCMVKRTEGFMKHLQNSGVKLLLSSVKQSETALFYAKLSGISVVDCLSPEEISLLCRLTGKSPEYKPCWEMLHGEVTETLKVTFCQPLLLGSHRYVHLGVTSTCVFEPHCLVVCGPVKGLTEQHVSAFHGGFKMLKQLFKALDVMSDHEAEKEIQTGDHSFGLGDIFSNMDKQQESHNKRTHRKGVDSVAWKDTDAVNTERDLQNKSQDNSVPNVEFECGVTCSALVHNGCNASSYNKVTPKCLMQKDVHETINKGNNFIEEDRTLQIAQQLNSKRDSWEAVSSQAECLQSNACDRLPERHSELFITAGSVLPVGGTFEILLHYYLHQHAKHSKNAELALVSVLFADALLGIPRNIHRSPKGNANFLQVYTAAINAVRTNKPILTNQKGLESVACKYQLVSSVLHCIVKLVTVDLVIGIKKGPQRMDDS